MHIKIYAAILALGLAGAGQAAPAGAAPAPGGVYPLMPGMYVAQGSDCAAPPNAALRQYDGKGIGSAHTHACRATVRAHVGKTYTVEQSCIDAGAGPAPRTSERQRIVVRNARTFVQTVGDGDTTYHYCPASRLPADLR